MKLILGKGKGLRCGLAVCLPWSKHPANTCFRVLAIIPRPAPLCSFSFNLLNIYVSDFWHGLSKKGTGLSKGIDDGNRRRFTQLMELVHRWEEGHVSACVMVGREGIGTAVKDTKGRRSR